MIKRNLYFKDGTLFANGYERVVHGGRGKYVELTKEQIEVSMVSKFNASIPDEITNEPFYYYWLLPIGRQDKIYWQCNTVQYADYKVNYYYICPKLLKKFNDCTEVF